jgi:arabinose-5-phosphate isomerase
MEYLESINNKLSIYSDEICKRSSSMSLSIELLLKILSNNNNSIYITGIGKSGHISKKCVSTWQSLGIHAYYILNQDIFHGDMGVIKEGDILIYISNSGNTEELINTAKYIKEKFNILQISVSNNINAQISQYVNHNIVISNTQIKEADNFNKVPSVSSILFMMFLDIVGIQLSENKNNTKKQFMLYHPAGELGKKDT